MLGFKILNKIISLTITDHECNRPANILDCKMGALPLKYLGVLLHWKKLRNKY
jgi:hypothetical protein